MSTETQQQLLKKFYDDFPSGSDLGAACRSGAEALRLIDLIAAEFDSDPASVACFDLNAIVRPTVLLGDNPRAYWNVPPGVTP